ncbi:MAG: CvpA family protein [Clostridiales Family XIII bacterium]|jgi:uncharacterized membrane protein required for colicin V production|nr:CvpA family protein [Clostridiales Family XIII bacterium]
MIIDAAIALIVLFFLFLGFKNGFIRSILSTFGWALAIAAAYFLRKPFQKLLVEHTTVYDHLYEKTGKLMTGLTVQFQGETSDDSIPGVLKNTIEDTSESIAAKAAEETAGILLSIIAFLTLIVILKLLFQIISVLFSKQYRRRGIVGGLDGLAGAVLGLAQATLLVLVLLALLLPASYLISMDAYNWVVHSMDRSIFSQYLYEHNPLLTLVREYVPRDLLPAEWFT